METIGIELSDAGILAAAAEGPLLSVDESATESPGVAVIEKQRMTLGQAAHKISRLRPHRLHQRFWDQLNVESLRVQGNKTLNHAEIAFAHLQHVCNSLDCKHCALMMAVPDYFDHTQLGLLLGIAQELKLDIRGLVASSVAAAQALWPDHLLLHVDISLHRAIVTYLEQGLQLTLKDLAWVTGRGISFLYTEWSKLIAEEFVRQTRFDPFHRAETEQALYNQMAATLEYFQAQPRALVELAAGNQRHQAALLREDFEQRADTVYREIRQLITAVHERQGGPQQPMALQISHRIARLPGLRLQLSELCQGSIVDLEAGAAARGAAGLVVQFSGSQNAAAIPYLNARPWPPAQQAAERPVQAAPAMVHRPTHLLQGHTAYPLAAGPLVIGRMSGSEEGLVVRRRHEASPDHVLCTLELQGSELILHVGATPITVDQAPATSHQALHLGQIIAIGEASEHLQIIHCLADDATPNR